MLSGRKRRIVREACRADFPSQEPCCVVPTGTGEGTSARMHAANSQGDRAKESHRSACRHNTNSSRLHTTSPGDICGRRKSLSRYAAENCWRKRNILEGFLKIHMYTSSNYTSLKNISKYLFDASGRMDFTRGNLKPKSASSIVHALSCRLFGCNSLIYVFLAFRICSFSSKSPPGIFSNSVWRYSGSAKRAHFWRYDPPGKSPQALCTIKAILDFGFLEITSLLGLLNCNRHNRQDRACRIELADLGLGSPLVKSSVADANIFNFLPKTSKNLILHLKTSVFLSQPNLPSKKICPTGGSCMPLPYSRIWGYSGASETLWILRMLGYFVASDVP